MTINAEFRIVFQPKNPALFNNRRRFAIGGGQIAKYIGEHNAEVAIERAFNGTSDKCVVKLRKQGTIIFYNK